MPTFMCFLNWTDQGAKAVKEAPKRYEMVEDVVAQLGGRLVSAYATTGQYDVALTVVPPSRARLPSADPYILIRAMRATHWARDQRERRAGMSEFDTDGPTADDLPAKAFADRITR